MGRISVITIGDPIMKNFLTKLSHRIVLTTVATQVVLAILANPAMAQAPSPGQTSSQNQQIQELSFNLQQIQETKP